MAKIKTYIKSLKDYRHWIMLAVIAASLAFIPFFFRYAHLRIWESCVALWNSLKYYVSELLGIELHGELTVNDFTEQPFGMPLNLPRTWDEFKVNISGYWGLFFSMDNFSAYMGKVADVLFYITKIILIICPVFLVIVIVNLVKGRKQNNDYAKESKLLRVFKRFEIKVCKPVKNWCIDIYYFVLGHKGYLKLLAWIWAYAFNVIAIVISFFAYYLYFISALKTVTVYIQLVKLLMDLSVMIEFIPKFLWVIAGIVVLNVIARRIAFNKLEHNERCNRGFINERGVSSTVDGPMGLGKTQFITDMALSEEVQLRDMALEVIIESDFHFPNFPWINLELFLKKMFEKHRIYDVWSCRRVIRSKYLEWCIKPCKQRIFGYDYENYGLIYNDELKDITVWQAIEDYACAYLIYTRQCALLVSNYSIRSDNLIDDIGNFPLWDTDFFHRDSRLIESYSRHSHIIDYDMLRLGTVMNAENPNRYAFGYGVYVISEIDKERSNSKKIKEKKELSECNQNNDLFDLNTMMSRHAVTIGHRCFLKIFSDLQRVEELGISTLGLGERVSIENKTEMCPVLPFFSTFWLFDLVAGFIINKFDKYYFNRRHDRGDYTLFAYLMKNFVAKLRSHRERVNNLFGCSRLTLSIEQGRKDGEGAKRKYYVQSKKIWSERYSTDCLSGIYEARGKLNTVGIDDIEEYDGIMASDEELQKQHSHFQYEVHKVLIK
ncbi:MAG: hypothetical protein NC131_21325 [Roseburia sp.]|nr:hypothetical protein [Roseburia sp.]